jgi:hypothetical protein
MVCKYCHTESPRDPETGYDAETVCHRPECQRREESDLIADEDWRQGYDEWLTWLDERQRAVDGENYTAFARAWFELSRRIGGTVELWRASDYDAAGELVQVYPLEWTADQIRDHAAQMAASQGVRLIER